MKFWISVMVLCLATAILQADERKIIRQMKSEKRVALVVGNRDYRNFSILKNPINDSRDMRDKLKQKGFEVLYLENANQKKLDKAVDKFSIKLQSASIGLFYFAGHGVEVEKKNYLIPVELELKEQVDIKYDALSVDRVVDKMKSGRTRLNFVILDACRNNPFKRGLGGLAPMSNAKGTLIAYATDSGESASDNSKGKNGLFTKYFLKFMDAPLNQRDFFHEIRKAVYEESRQKQMPYLNNGTIGDFYFTIPEQITQKDSIFSFSNKAPTSFSLIINITPKNATVKFLNSSISYQDGIMLKKGIYKIEVSKKGYYTKSGKIDLQKDTKIDMKLDRRVRLNRTKLDTPTKSHSLKGITIIDGLMYQNDKPFTKEYTWKDGKKYCRNLSLGGYDNWRLPTKNELVKLGNIKLNVPWVSGWFDKNKHRRLKNSKGHYHFIKKEFIENLAKYSYFWTSSLIGSSSAWIFDFLYGYDGYYDKSVDLYVLCVRGQ